MTRPFSSAPIFDRRSFIGGSDARIIMGSDEAALVRLWREKRGEAEPGDLSGNLVVQLGRATEQLNRSWYERNSGRPVRDVQRRVRHSAIPWMAATLDGIVEGMQAVFEAKFMLPWSFSEGGSGREVHGASPAQYAGHPSEKLAMPEDAKEAIGHGVRAKRSKAGAVSFDILTTEAVHAPVQ